MLSIGLAALPGSRKHPDNCICQTHQSLERSLRVCTGQVMSRQPCKVLYGSRYRGVAAVRFIRSAAMMSRIKKTVTCLTGGENNPIRITLPPDPFSCYHRSGQGPARPQNAAGRSPSSERGEFPGGWQGNRIRASR